MERAKKNLVSNENIKGLLLYKGNTHFSFTFCILFYTRVARPSEVVLAKQGRHRGAASTSKTLEKRRISISHLFTNQNLTQIVLDVVAG